MASSLGEPDPMYILPVLSALSTWIMSKQTSSGATGAAAQQQKIMTIFMPLFIGYISLNFPSGFSYLLDRIQCIPICATTFHLQKLRS